MTTESLTGTILEDEEREQEIGNELVTPPETQIAQAANTGERFPTESGAPPDSSSAVDLSAPGNKDQMLKERDEWQDLPIDDPTREMLEDQWYRRYYNKSKDEVKTYARQNSGIYGSGGNPIKVLDNTLQGLSTAGLGVMDFGMDVVGMIPGAAPLDDLWDKKTQLDNPIHQQIRDIASIVIPSMYFGGVGAKKLAASQTVQQLNRAQKFLAYAGTNIAIDMAVIGVSDQGEEENITRIMADTFPGVWGPEGITPLPDWTKTLDSDSPAVRRYKNMFTDGALSFMGSTLGMFIELKGGKPRMSWMTPQDAAARAYKAREISKYSDPEKLVRIQEIRQNLTTGKLSKTVEKQLVQELDNLLESLDNIDNVDDALRQLDISETTEVDTAARSKIERGDVDADTFDPDVSPVMQSGNSRQSVPPGNVARNMADVAANKTGVTVGDNAPVITESMRAKGLMIGSTSRDAVMGVAEEARDLGRFNALVDGFRFTNKQMDAAAWSVYESIIAAENMDDLKGIFLEDRDVKNLLMGKFKVEYINEEQARGAAFAMRDLVDRFLGRRIALSSGRVMDTLGREVATMGEAIQQLEPFIDDDRAMDLIIDKLQFLMDEWALNKYIAGWSLKNKDWYNAIVPANVDEVVTELTKEFKNAENSIHAKNLRFTKTLKELAETNPMAMRPLMDAFAHSKGDVDTLAKLMKWSADQITPTGLIKSPDPKELNLFARGAWAVVYNNVLSGISSLRAIVGNGVQLILKPITALLGHGILGPLDNWDGFKRTIYYNGAVYETNRRALKDAYDMMKKAHKDPELMVKAYRKDLTLPSDDARWKILEDMRPVWEAEGNVGRLMQLDMATNMRDLAKLPGLRYGMTAMVFPDVFTNTHMAHYVSRMRAYDEVFEEFGFADWKKIAIAEKKHYKTMFDENGLLKDNVAKAFSGEISLNLPDDTATWINKATTAYPITKHILMFPRTQSNVVKNALSWTPISAIPGINKYSKTIWAQTDDQIARALAEHGIDMASTPNARIIFENLRAEYVGRIAFSSLLTKSLTDYAIAGNIRGNGHYSADRRKKERDQYGYEPKTINLGGKWVNYKGIPGVDPILSTIGDMAYYMSDIDAPFWEDWQAKIMWSISASFLSETPLTGIEPLVAAANGDLTAWNRLTANALRGYIPMSGALGVLENAVSSTQKDIEGEVWEYVANRLPIISGVLEDRIDIWTGEPLNDIDNPILKALNAFMPQQVSGTAEPWRKWLLQTGYRGLSKLNKDSTGSYEYSTKERQLINKYIGEQKPWKKIDRMMKSGKYDKQLLDLRKHRSGSGDLTNEKIELRVNQLPVVKDIAAMMREAQKVAELKLLQTHPEIANAILHQRLVTGAMNQGNVPLAGELQQKELDTRNLLNMIK